ncbi:hypothetical protein HTX81_00710 [Pseudomonas lini]|uniref:hypothetical protein n=1 Tax=Pseudomonas lini TaxID=163011 RepID=UPI0005794595|nr:hypothetical protein [Pseudomonas lini]NSX07097.1 hypothetical protein [Pseudomonas lini]
MDLLTPLFAPDRLHQHFKSITDDRRGRHYARCELLRWLAGFPDRDKKFVKEFQTTFNSSFWEIYLYAVFRDYGFAFDWKFPAPDFLLTAKEKTFTVEATTANHAAGEMPEWEKELTPDYFDNIDFNELNRVAIIRLASAFSTKSDKFKEKYCNHDHVKGRSFVLALAPFEQPKFNLQAYRAIEALLFDYYVDEAEYLASPEKFPNGPEGRSLGTVQKSNGTEIELGFFNSPRFKHISAVIFSNLATWGKVDAMSGNPLSMIASIRSFPDGALRRKVCRGNESSETLTDGLRIYHNPYATDPLPLEVFRKEGVVQMWADVDAYALHSEQTDNCLQSRTAFTVLIAEDDDPAFAKPDS